MDNLTAVVPFWNGHNTITRLLDSLPGDLPVLIVDDSSDEALAVDRPNVTVVRPKAKGYFAGAVNIAMGLVKTDLLILNQDIWFEGLGWRDLLAENRARYGLIGEAAGHNPKWPAGYVHGTFMFIRSDVARAVGPMNEADYPLWGATCEYQLRACRKGFRPLLLPHVPGMRHERRGNYGAAISEMLTRRPNRRGWFIRTPPLISVIIPCYNHGHFLQDAVNSLVGGPTCLGESPGQTLQSFEVIIVDDASTDGSFEVCKALADDWKGIRCIRMKRNGGTAAAHNIGIAAAWGTHITCMSADDMMEPWRLDALYRACEQNEHDFAYDDMTKVVPDENSPTGWARGGRWAIQQYDFEKLIYRNQIHVGIMYPRVAWEEVGGYPEMMNRGREDWAFNVALGRKGWCGVKVERPGYLYRRYGGNRTNTNTTRKWHQFFFEQIQQLFPDLYQGERPMGCCGDNRSRGGGGSSPPRPARRSRRGGAVDFAPPAPAPDAGQVMVKYIGTNAGNMTWYGPVSGKRYTFGGITKVGAIDERDAPDMLEIREFGRLVFDRYAPEQPKPRKPRAVEVRPAEAEAIVQVSPLAAARIAVNLSVKEIKDLRLTGEQWAELLRLEGERESPRKSVLVFAGKKVVNAAA